MLMQQIQFCTVEVAAVHTVLFPFSHQKLAWASSSQKLDVSSDSLVTALEQHDMLLPQCPKPTCMIVMQWH